MRNKNGTLLNYPLGIPDEGEEGLILLNGNTVGVLTVMYNFTNGSRADFSAHYSRRPGMNLTKYWKRSCNNEDGFFILKNEYNGLNLHSNNLSKNNLFVGYATWPKSKEKMYSFTNEKST